MKKYLWIFLILFLAVISGCSSHSVAKINNLKGKTAFSDKEIETIFKHTKKFPTNTQLSIAKIKNGKVDFYGVIRQDNSIESIDNHNKVFKIGSLSKIFTSTLLAQMVIDKKVNLDDDIQNSLKIQLHSNPKITYKQLANHTSGLPNMPYFSDKHHYENYSYNDLENYLQTRLELKYKQNKFNYSNLGVAILGYSISKIEGKSYEELLQEKILKKLNMNNTTTIENKIKTKLILPTEVDYTISPAMVGVGGIFSSVEDLSKFAKASYEDTNKALKLTQKETFMQKDFFDVTKVGLAWGISYEDFTETLHLHQGNIGGYASFIVLDIKNKNGIIILSHQSSFYDNESNDIGSLSMELLELMY